MRLEGLRELRGDPLAAASLAQVHRAALRDGRAVAVKVQRPGVREQILEDLEDMADLADFLDRHTEAGSRYEFGRLWTSSGPASWPSSTTARRRRTWSTIGAQLAGSSASSSRRRSTTTRPRGVLTMDSSPAAR